MTDPSSPGTTDSIDRPLPLLTPPDYCHYADGPCDQEFPTFADESVFFLYPSHPAQIAATIEAAVSAPRRLFADQPWTTWRGLPIAGQVIFCEICKAMRTAHAVIADVTTLNFNLLFEIGFAIGLGLPVLPIRDTSYQLDKRSFEQLGLLDTIGYIDFTNAQNLVDNVTARLPATPLPTIRTVPHTDSPLYVLKGPIDTEGAIQLLATLKKSALRFRTYDHVETPRLSLHEARRQVMSSIGVISHLLSPNRVGAQAHNAMCALLSGIAMAQNKVVVMLQEEGLQQPIDYRDVVQSYDVPSQIPAILERPIRAIVQHLQLSAYPKGRAPQPVLLERLDLGDVAAENEILGLPTYFVRTGQFNQAVQGHARLVVGRKGTGKTAIFYRIRGTVRKGRSTVILDLKPEGHQFTKLRESVLAHMSRGLQEHTLVAFWNYILLVELARKIIDSDRTHVAYDAEGLHRYDRIRALYSKHDPGHDADFSQRLLHEVDRVAAALGPVPVDQLEPQLTQLIFAGDVRDLSDAVADYVVEKDGVWLLIDNLDKGWPTHGTTEADILIVRALLEATRKLQRQLQGRNVDFGCLVFLRTDIYEHLVRQTPDKGKDTPISLDWEDRSLFEQIIKKRIEASTELRADDFRTVWHRLFESHIGTEDSFNYMLDRTLMRPRDLLQFIRRAIEFAVNRGHHTVKEEDIREAEVSYSEDLLLTTAFEIVDSYPEGENALYAFQGKRDMLTRDEVSDILRSAGVIDDDIDKAVDLLLWFGFLGVASPAYEGVKYSYSVHYNLRRLKHPIDTEDGFFVIHPAFRAALDIKG